MQRFRSLWSSKTSLTAKNLRFMSSLALNPCADLLELDDQFTQPSVIVEDINAKGKMVLLNRPHVLNALDTTMAAKLLELYGSWDKDDNVGFIIAKGNGRAFCAGGDVVGAYNMINEGRIEDCKEFFRTCYSLIYLISSFSKPNVAILDGITMGGGSGISVPGSFRVATDKTVFAVPETLIGFHPDGAASHYLSRLPGFLGEYLALTGDRLTGAEMVACGLATHYIHSTQIHLLEEALSELETNDPSTIRNLLDNLGEMTSIPLHGHSILNRLGLINECFGYNTVEDIFSSLERKARGAEDEWCSSTLKKLTQTSPLSLKISLRSIREGRLQTLHQCMAREYAITLQAIHANISNDFYEGVRTRLVDKTFTPKWDPSSLSQVTEDMVHQYFLPL